MNKGELVKKNRSLQIDNENLQKRIGMAEDIVRILNKQCEGYQTSLDSARMFILALVNDTDDKCVEYKTEALSELLKTKYIDFQKITSDGKHIGTRLEMKDVEVQQQENDD